MVLRFTILLLLGAAAITISSAGTVAQRSKRQEIVMEYHPQCYDDDDCEPGFLCYVMDQYDDYGYCEAALVSGSENYPCTDDDNCNIGLTCVYSSKFEEHGHCLDVFDSI